MYMYIYISTKLALKIAKFSKLIRTYKDVI